MIRYQYVTALTPPAPFVNVSLRCATTGREASGLAAQVDPGADRTVLPGTVVAAMALVSDGRAAFQGFAGQYLELPLFLVEVHIHDLPPVRVRAAAQEHEPHILLGRDVLNVYRLLLDGPQLALEIRLFRVERIALAADGGEPMQTKANAGACSDPLGPVADFRERRREERALAPEVPAVFRPAPPYRTEPARSLAP